MFENLTLNVWDVGGQDRIRKLWRHYFEGSDALIWVVDANDSERLEEARHELHSMLQEDELRGAKVLIYANKTDLPNSCSVAEVASKLKLSTLTRHEWHVQSACGLTGDGLYEGLSWVADAIKSSPSGRGNSTNASSSTWSAAPAARSTVGVR